MKIDIIVVHIKRYNRGHEIHFVPPITGIYLAALIPSKHTVRVIHQEVQHIDFSTDADLIAMTFFSGFADEAYKIADRFRAMGKTVVAGGPHVTFCPDESSSHFDSIVLGEAELAWPKLILDLDSGELKPKYTGISGPLSDLPLPRYDLLSKRFFVPRVVQATRGCPFTCSFCTVPTLNPGFRTRPISSIIRDVKYDKFNHWWQRKIVWFWDDNLTAKRDFVKLLLVEMIPLRRWWLTQASMDISRDYPLLDLMKKSGCIGIFFGIESFGEDSLKDANKRQNKITEYMKQISQLHKRGICVMAGFICGFDSDTPETIRAMARQLYDAGVDVPFLSILTPFRGTKLHAQLLQEDRILTDREWVHYNGYNVAFSPAKMTAEQLLLAHRELWKEVFSIKYSCLRILRSISKLRLGGFLMCTMMNGFYCWKQITGNAPKEFSVDLSYK